MSAAGRKVLYTADLRWGPEEPLVVAEAASFPVAVIVLDHANRARLPVGRSRGTWAL